MYVVSDWRQGWIPRCSIPNVLCISTALPPEEPTFLQFRKRDMEYITGVLEGRLVPSAFVCSASLAVYWLAWVVYSRTFHPLAKVPGPAWASLSRTWLMYRMYLGDYQVAQLALHKE